ncbi:MAG: hypothetical protein ACRC8R_14905 [Aeromonas hydrophila]
MAFTLEEFDKARRFVFGERYRIVTGRKVNTAHKFCEVHQMGFFVDTTRQLTDWLGCPGCSGLADYTEESYLEAARAMHTVGPIQVWWFPQLLKYRFLREYGDRITDVLIGCEVHGVLHNIHPVAHHLRGAGCPKCAALGPQPHGKQLYPAKIVHPDGLSFYRIGASFNKADELKEALPPAGARPRYLVDDPFEWYPMG